MFGVANWRQSAWKVKEAAWLGGNEWRDLGEVRRKVSRYIGPGER